METKSQQRNLPAIVDLYNEEKMELTGKMNDLNVLLNQPPNPAWLKTHPYISGYKYLPVERIEYLLTRIFIRWRCEVKDVKLLANSVQVTVRLHVLDPITGEWEWQDGVGASPLQTDSGSGAVDFNKLKSAAVMMATPAAKSYAFKDAAECFGKLFGKDINRKDEIGYSGLATTLEGAMTLKQAKDAVEKMLRTCPDELLQESVAGEIVEARTAGVDSIDFYNRMISKLADNGKA